ncbi:MAG: energy transducer TonB [Ketobacter sp.]|nr:MAG: energy transducer TonB [Ketobacter sp.]
MENTWSNSLLLMVVLLAHGAALGAVALLQQDAPVPDELPSISGVLIQAPPAKTVQAPPAVREPVQQQSVQKTPQTLQPLTQRPKHSAETPKLTKPVPEQTETPAPKPVPQVTESTPRPAPATTDPYEGTPVTAPNTRQHRNPDPRYPSLSRRRGEEGTVILELLVLKDGSVENVTIKESSGFPRLDKSAMEAVRRWKYNPAKRGGQAIDYRYLQPVTFSLQG